MHPRSRELQEMMNSLLSQPHDDSQIQKQQFDIPTCDEFVDQMLSSSTWASVEHNPSWETTTPLPFPLLAQQQQQQQQMVMMMMTSLTSDEGQNDSVNGLGQLLKQSENQQGQVEPQESASKAQNKPKVRARRGQATDPHSIAERLRREKIAERMKALQELVPNANKTDKSSMLDEIIDYVKFLQLQVKVLSISRLGGAAAVAPLVSEGGSNVVQSNASGNQTSSSNENSLSMTEQQVAKLMEDDMGSAMQYLQGKGLCLMPISLATAISTSPKMSFLPVQSTASVNNAFEGSLQNSASVSKP